MILDDILSRTAERVESIPRARGEYSRGTCRSLEASIRDVKYSPSPRHAIIAELKFSSPSRGSIRPYSDPRGLALEFVQNGCIALSVHTEPHYFHGSPEDLHAVREAVAVPVLRKDFIIDDRQLEESLDMGADAVLLISGVLKEKLPSFVERCAELGIEPLVEVRDRKDTEIALQSGARIIGINNRDLTTLQVSLRPTIRLGEMIRRSGRLVVSESGILWPYDVRLLKDYCDAYLIGTSLMRSPSPAKALEGFVFG
ncbi:indole-3-glycerol phosphate synthase [Methanolinea mesophila]|uniref:indole-3-glycerol phosphate synthase TrpC n=1 Tax=Methanolinea mesophila TaxID=547055 RepID=UPI001AE96A6D|nr:indole-3-glycerol-phosphate synthase [Methanolinea mesophila]MBP1929313.1 indole-3-glycerol phosphate synthase [Methanolinea mesophila]